MLLFLLGSLALSTTGAPPPDRILRGHEDIARRVKSQGLFEPVRVKQNTLIFLYKDECADSTLIEEITGIASATLRGLYTPVFYNNYEKSSELVEHFNLDMSYADCLQVAWIRRGFFPRVFQYVPSVSGPFAAWFSGEKTVANVTFSMNSHMPGVLINVEPDPTNSSMEIETQQANNNENLMSTLGMRFRVRTPNNELTREDTLKDANIQIYSGHSPVRLFNKLHFQEIVFNKDRWFSQDDTPKPTVVVFHDKNSKALGRRVRRLLLQVLDPMYVRVAFYDVDADNGELADYLNFTRAGQGADQCVIQDGRKLGRGRPVIGFFGRGASIGDNGFTGVSWFKEESAKDVQCESAAQQDKPSADTIMRWVIAQVIVKIELVNMNNFAVEFFLDYKSNAADFKRFDHLSLGVMPARSQTEIQCSIGDRLEVFKKANKKSLGKYVVLESRKITSTAGTHITDELDEWIEFSRYIVDRDHVRQLNYHYMTQLSNIEHYNEVGFHKTRIPEAAVPLLEKWRSDCQTDIERGMIEPHSMHWQHLNAHEAYMTGLAPEHNFSQIVGDIVRPTIEEFMQTQLKFSVMSMHIYLNNSVVAAHVDNPFHHVVGVIMNLEMDTDEPWMLTVVDHSGKTHSMPTYPGDMVIYEAATIIHSRPKHMRGRRVSNAFLHYQPYNWASNDYFQWEEPYNNPAWIPQNAAL